MKRKSLIKRLTAGILVAALTVGIFSVATIDQPGCATAYWDSKLYEPTLNWYFDNITSDRLCCAKGFKKYIYNPTIREIYDKKYAKYKGNLLSLKVFKNTGYLPEGKQHKILKYNYEKNNYVVGDDRYGSGFWLCYNGRYRSAEIRYMINHGEKVILEHMALLQDSGLLSKSYKYTGSIRVTPKIYFWNGFDEATSITKSCGDDAFDLNVSTTSSGKMSYKSSNTNVATISKDGKVTIKKAGTTTITVNVAADVPYNAASKSIKLTVNPKSSDDQAASGKKYKNPSAVDSISATYVDVDIFSMGVNIGFTFSEENIRSGNLRFTLLRSGNNGKTWKEVNVWEYKCKITNKSKKEREKYDNFINDSNYLGNENYPEWFTFSEINLKPQDTPYKYKVVVDRVVNGKVVATSENNPEAEVTVFCRPLTETFSAIKW